MLASLIYENLGAHGNGLWLARVTATNHAGSRFASAVFALGKAYAKNTASKVVYEAIICNSRKFKLLASLYSLAILLFIRSVTWPSPQKPLC